MDMLVFLIFALDRSNMELYTHCYQLEGFWHISNRVTLPYVLSYSAFCNKTLHGKMVHIQGAQRCK